MRRWLRFPQRRGLASAAICDARVALWQRELARQQPQLEAQRAAALVRAEPVELAVETPAGARLAFRGLRGVSTAVDVLRELQARGGPKFQAVAAEMGGEAVDLRAPLEASGHLKLLECVRSKLEIDGQERR